MFSFEKEHEDLRLQNISLKSAIVWVVGFKDNDLKVNLSETPSNMRFASAELEEQLVSEITTVEDQRLSNEGLVFQLIVVMCTCA